VILAVDTSPLSNRFRYAGTGVYTFHLMSEWLKNAAAYDSDIELHGFVAANDDWTKNGFTSPFLKVHESRFMTRLPIWIWGGLALNVARIRPDVVFLPSVMSSVQWPFTPFVSTIHDASQERLPLAFSEVGMNGRYLSRMNAKLSTKIITISEWSKKEIVEAYGLPPEKIQVTYNGYNRVLYNSAPPNAEASSELLNRWGIGKSFILHPGRVELRKNVHRLIQAWDRLRGLSKDFDAQLVLAGPMGCGHEEILKVREGSSYREQVIVTGPLSGSDLAMLIKNASLCVFPSIYEGFCIPMVEAMACGVPTVASNSSCLPEVSGGVLEYFDPNSVEEMGDVIRRALEDSDLRKRLREKGLLRASQFSWERCARETLSALTEVANEHLPKRKTIKASPITVSTRDR